MNAQVRDLGQDQWALGGAYYHTNTQVEARETLLRKLLDLTASAPSCTDRPQPRRLEDNQTQASSGVTRLARQTSELGDQFGIG
jgi:hypothetical protein